VVFPLFPQYSSAATGSAIEEVTTRAAQAINTPYLQIVPPFYDDPGFIRAFAEITRPYMERVRPERIFLSFHGLPERQVRDADDRGHGCLDFPDCCHAIVPGNENCYRAQCYRTAELLSAELGLEPGQAVVCFQSRLGRIPWIRPYTDEVVVEAAREGCRRALILSPAFVADCLETLEELGLRAAESFRENGGETLELVPSLNAEEAWVDAALAIIRKQTSWLDESR
jgi:ferrochelatase